MNKVNEVEVKVASRLRAICQPVDVAVRAAVALGAAAFVVSAPGIAYAAAPPDSYLVDGRDGGIYAQIAGEDSIGGWGNAPVLANPNFGAQSEYEAYILSLDPANRPAEAESAVVIPSPNFGSQSQYEAYIAALSPENRPADRPADRPVDRPAISSYAVPVMIDKDERAFLAVGSKGSLIIESAPTSNGMVYRVPEAGPPSSSQSSYAAQVMIDKSERAFLGTQSKIASSGDVSLANVAPSSAATANEYAVGNVVESGVREIVVVGPGDFAEGYDWYVDPVALRAASIPNNRYSAVQPDVLRGPYDAPATSAIAAQPALSPQEQLQALFQNGHITRGVLEAEIAAQANYARAKGQVTLSPEQQLQALYQNGHITRGVLDAEIAAQANYARSNQQANPAALSPEEQLQSLYQNGHISYEVMRAEVAAYAYVPMPAS